MVGCIAVAVIMKNHGLAPSRFSEFRADKFDAVIGIVARARVEYTKEYQQLIIKQKAIIKEADQNLEKCKSIIANTHIHPSYHKIETLNKLLYYFEYNFANTIAEAVNLMRNDARYAQMQKEMKAQSAELRRHNQMLAYIEQENKRRHEEIQSELRSISAGQDQIIELERSISSSCFSAAADLRYISSAYKSKRFIKTTALSM